MDAGESSVLPPSPPPPESAPGNLYKFLTFKEQVLNMEKLREIFDQYDADHDGTLNEAELTAMLHDMWSASIQDARESGASVGYLTKVSKELESAKGKAILKRSVEELLTLRDTNHDGVISWKEVEACMSFEEELSEGGSYWRLAPLADVHIELKDLVDPYGKEKVFVAGAIAGGFAKTAGSPLARITILLQTAGMPTKLSGDGYVTNKGMWALMKDVHQKEGMKGLFKGNATDIFRSLVANGVNYLAYEWWKDIIMPYDSSSSGVGARFLAGGMSGVTSVTVMYPIDLVRTRLAVQREKAYSGPLNALATIVKTEGVLGMYRGMFVAWAQIFPNLALNYAIYETTRNYLRQQGHTGLLPSLACGITAGTTAGCVTFPLEIVMRRMQLTGVGERGRKDSAFKVASALYRQTGVKGFYAGLLPQMLRAVPTCATSFAVYDQMKRLLHLEIS